MLLAIVGTGPVGGSSYAARDCWDRQKELASSVAAPSYVNSVQHGLQHPPYIFQQHQLAFFIGVDSICL